jgi:hypothetical protein
LCKDSCSKKEEEKRAKRTGEAHWRLLPASHAPAKGTRAIGQVS